MSKNLSEMRLLSYNKILEHEIGHRLDECGTYLLLYSLLDFGELLMWPIQSEVIVLSLLLLNQPDYFPVDI